MTAEQIAAVLGHPIGQAAAVADAPLSPGQLRATMHRTRGSGSMRLTRVTAKRCWRLDGRRRRGASSSISVLRVIFGKRRRTSCGAEGVRCGGFGGEAVMPIPETGLGVASTTVCVAPPRHVRDRKRRMRTPHVNAPTPHLLDVLTRIVGTHMPCAPGIRVRPSICANGGTAMLALHLLC